ncbi:MAG: adenylate/guanylate cyclase domain-containing protein, partial [Actinomycetota bacterium]|nr:adenylate/guanylate cyclase domain-containing protein [Actinomycetota bacterium]
MRGGLAGTVTFLFTDIEGSTRLWEEQPEAMRAALARHDAILRDAVIAHRGSVVKTTGDGIFAAFAAARDAVTAALAGQRALSAERLGQTGPLRVRMGLHTGAAELRDGDYFGADVNRTARLMAAGHGGQILVSGATEELVRDQLPEASSLVGLGEHRLRGLERREAVFQLAHPDLVVEFPRLQSLDSTPGNLPRPVSSFVGRELGVSRVGDALDRAQVVTLTGVGGVGKTRLALRAAAELWPGYRDGAWFCELAPARGPEEVPDAILEMFGIQARPAKTAAETLVEFLRAKELLLVLDNCE